MRRLIPHTEAHASARVGWLRAAVMGANDGIVSTASLIIGVAAANTSHNGVFVAGISALFAGAMSMAAGEYVSVSSQADSEKADLAREAKELADEPDQELDELTSLYEQRGVEPETARAVAEQMTAYDALGAHGRDELGITQVTMARPLQAAFASALAFTTGAAAPVAVVPLAAPHLLAPTVGIVSLICLAALGALGARTGGSSVMPAVLRVTFWGALAMAVTAGVGKAFAAILG
mgnify:CR=1 FL=1